MRRQFRGLGQDEDAESCPVAAHWDDALNTCVCNSRDDIMVGGRCKDKSTLCGPGTQWVDKDQACVPLTKYMSPQQIEAAKRAGIDLTGKGGAVITTTPVVVTSSPPKSTLASLFGGANGMWLVGGAAVGLSILALMNRSGSNYRPNRRRQRARRPSESSESKLRRAIRELSVLRKEDRQTLKHLHSDMRRFARLERSLKSVL